MFTPIFLRVFSCFGRRTFCSPPLGWPGLRREATSRVDTILFGNYPVTFIHELYFDSLDDAGQALSSPEGRAAGKLLQEMTQGRVNLFFADHKVDVIENILKYKKSAQTDE